MRQDKVAIIARAGTGIGAATAAPFAEEGARVVVADREPARAEAVAGLPGALAVTADTADTAAVARMVGAAMQAHGRIDILVNNVGFGARGSVAETAGDDRDRPLAATLKGVPLCSRAVIPQRAAQNGGAIVNTAPAVAQGGLADHAACVACKGGVAAVARAMALDRAARRIRVNAVAPGVAWSGCFDRMPETHPDPEGFVAAPDARGPMNRTARRREVAQAILWLASGGSSFAGLRRRVDPDPGWRYDRLAAPRAARTHQARTTS